MSQNLKDMVKKVFLLGVPLLFGQLMRYLHQVADSAMLGHFGENSYELGAIGIAGLFTWILNTFLWPLSQGVQAITARRFGKQDHGDQASKHFTGEALDNGIVTAIYATGVALLVSFTARPILSRLIETPQILELSLDYIGIMRFSLLHTGIFFVIQGFFGAINKTRYIMYSGIMSNLLNIALNYVFIFGKFGMPRMGIKGAALGTLLSLFMASVFLIIVIIKQGYHKEYHLFSFKRLNLQIQRDIVKVALPPGIQNIIALAIFMIYQTLIEDYSPILLAATHSVFSYFRLNKTIIGGFSRSAGILAGNALGRKNKKEAHQAITAAGLAGLTIALVIALVTVVFRKYIGLIFTGSPETAAQISRALLFFVPFYFVEALGYSFEMVFTSNGYGKYVLASEFTTNMLFILGLTLFMKNFFPGQILYAWFSFGTYQVCHALLMITGYFRKKWLHVEVDSTEGA